MGRRWIILETSKGNRIITQRLADGSVLFEVDEENIEERCARAEVLRSTTCAGSGPTLHALTQKLKDLVAAEGPAAPNESYAQMAYELASGKGFEEPPDATNEKPFIESNKSHVGKPVEFSLDCFRDFDPTKISVENVEPVDARYRTFGGRCMVLRHTMTQRECDYLIEQMGGHAEMEAVSYRHDYRRTDRAVFDSEELSALLWSRVAPYAAELAIRVDEDPAMQRLLSEQDMPGECPNELRVGYGREGVWRPSGLNNCLRFCKYNPGDYFRKHCDACYRRDQDEQSLFTCMFYLNGDFDGGSTRFLHLDRAGEYGAADQFKAAGDEDVMASVAPEPGLCMFFFQPGLLHEGEDLRSGLKFILRTDVMFTRDPASKPVLSPNQILALDLLGQAERAEEGREYDLACKLYRRAYKLDPRLEFMR